ncbi:MAG: hypothetical protein R2684_09620 [Pyrinomonadaceae bacterium]
MQNFKILKHRLKSYFSSVVDADDQTSDAPAKAIEIFAAVSENDLRNGGTQVRFFETGILRLRKAAGFVSVLGALALFPLLVSAQSTPSTTATPDASPSPSPAATPNLSETEIKARQVVESSILFYSNFRGRKGMDQIRKTAVEFGKLEIAGPTGSMMNIEYERRQLRGDSLGSTKIKFDQSLPNIRYSLVYDGGRVFGVSNGTTFDPRSDAVKSFTDREMRSIDALLRYNESDGKIDFARDEKILGVEYYVIKLDSPKSGTVEYFVSKKSFRVMMLDYKEDGVNYRRKFYSYDYAQNMLVPYKTVLWAGDKKIEEQVITTVTFGQDFTDDIFAFGE